MTPTWIRSAVHATLCSLAIVALTPAAAAFPEKPLRLIVQYSPGGAADNNVRMIAQKLAMRIGQPVVVDNKPGAAGMVAINALRSAPADGYTMLYTSASNAVSSAKPNPPYDLSKDFEPIIQVSAVPLIFYVNPKLPVTTMRELVAHIKANPGKLFYSSVGIGSSPHLAFEEFKQSLGLDVGHVPFKASSQTVTAVMAGDVQIGLDGLSAVIGHVQGERVRGLGITSSESNKLYPNLPGMKDAGFPQYKFISWTGFSALPGTPKEAIDKINRELDAVLKDPEVVKSYDVQAGRAVGGTPDAYRKLIAEEINNYAKVIRSGKIEIE